jgi:magnesium transporter
MPSPLARSRREIPIVLATTLVSFAPLSRAAALALTDLGAAALLVSGSTHASIGPAAPWFVLGAVLLGLACRAADIESWALFIPRGLLGRVHEAYGPRAAGAAGASALVERLFFAALAALVAGHYAFSFLGAVARTVPDDVHADLPTLAGVSLLGLMWIRARLGHVSSPARVARVIWIAVGVLAVVVIWGVVTIGLRSQWPLLLPRAHLQYPGPDATGWRHYLLPAWWIGLFLLSGLGHALPAIGGGDALTRDGAELPRPRVRSLRRVALVATIFALLAVTGLSFLFAAVVPGAAQSPWFNAPVLGLAQHVSGPNWLRFVLTGVVAVAAVMLLARASDAALSEARNVLFRLADKRPFAERLLRVHPRFGTPASMIDTIAAVTVLVVMASSGLVVWMAQAYAVALAATILWKVAALIKLRQYRKDPPYRVTLNLRIAGRERPIGLWLVAVPVAAAAVALLATGEVPALASAGGLLGLTLLLASSPLRAVPAPAGDLDPEQLLPSTHLSLDRIEPRPGTMLVTVRNPHALGHLVSALQTPPDREVVVMTVRLLGLDAQDDGVNETVPTAAERALFSRVAAVAERYQRPVRLLIVPARNVFDAIVDAVLRLQASEISVGESVTLSADAQARLLGEAWERAETSAGHEVHLVIHHNTGRSDTYHIGAHAPALTSGDLDLIHRLWLDAAKAVGPQVHHHDIVRAALTQMADQLTGPQREEALEAIRRTAKPADELAAIVRSRDYSRLRDMVRNQPPSDLAALLADLALDEQVVVFRLLPRKDAAATFEYLSTDSREVLLRAMAKEDVAALLNDMAPDDRTMFLEELPATVTRELLTLLSPTERAVALTLLGYPEGSIGRLMTPHYVAVHEEWTVQQVLDHVRSHGSDSETLNVIYVVDDRDLLVDDVRIREFLLTSTDTRVSDLMDRRFVALKATDDQQTAVAAFKQYDRSALPVTDTAGMLIGIVTVDDVLDVVEATATKDIQRIGGVEALDEPYMHVAFGRMIQKRAGWLTALFLGEMLTATAMGAFEAEIQKAVVLALFVPLIISSGGNSGSQASTLVIRALALGEVALMDWWKVMRRELAAGLALGAILGTIGFLRISVWSAFSTIYGEHWLLVAITVGLALVGIVLWGTLIGSLLPFLLRRLGFDPATSSAPFVATLVDVTGLVIYFTVALIVLRGTLL